MSTINRPTLSVVRRACATLVVLCVLHLGLWPAATPAWAQGPNFLNGFTGDPGGPTATTLPPALKEVSFKQRLDQQLPLDTTFKDDQGRTVRLGDYFGGTKPVVLAFVYYTCPMLCTQVMNGISGALRALPFEAGQDFDVVLISFDPRDTPASAAEKKRTHLEYWTTQATANGWHLLTGDEANIKRATEAAGFTYQWDDLTQQYAHVSGILIATPEGKLARYFYGVEYSPKELRLALVESGQGHIGSVVDELLLYCYHYDPSSGRYGATVMNLLRAGGVLTIAFILGIMFLSRRRDDSHAPVEGRA